MKKIIIAALCLLVGVALGFWGRRILPNFSKSKNEVNYATFDGGAILEQEVLDLIHAEVEQQKAALYELKLRVTTDLAKKRLLELEAKEQNLTPEAWLVKATAEYAVTTVDDQKIAAYLSNQGVDIKKASADQIEVARKLLISSKVMASGQDYVDRLFEKSNVQISIEK